MRPTLFCLAALLVCSSCAHKQPVALGLGKVVVYRNGVAYFERRARPDGRGLTIAVAKDAVDDFLKSLTVRDAHTGKALPISFPTRGNEKGEVVTMQVTLPADAPQELVLTYLTESPAWKPTYRLVIGDDDKVQIEGWAIVDNTSGETWKNVTVGVGSSSALSFRYDLWSVRDVERQTLGHTDSFAVAPPVGGSTYKESTGKENVVVELTDDQVNLPITHPKNGYVKNLPVPGRTFKSVIDSAGGSQSDDRGVSFSGSASIEQNYVVDGVNTTGLSHGTLGRRNRPDPAALKRAKQEAARQARERDELRRRFQRNERKAEQLARKLKSHKRVFIIEGYARSGESNPMSQARDRANVLRNKLIDKGVAPAQLVVRAFGAVDGRPAGVRLVAAQTIDDGPAPTPSDTPAGESHFQSPTPMTVLPDTSVMVSIVSTEASGELVYLYDADSERGNDRYAFKAVRLRNPTRNTLEGGPVTVYRRGGFVGEGMTDSIPARSNAIIPFALDRHVVVERKIDRRDRIAGLVSLQRGVMTANVQHIRESAFTMTNRTNRPLTVYTRHNLAKGWQLLDTSKNSKQVERIGGSHLFPLRLDAHQTRTLRIREATPMTRRLDLRGQVSLHLVEAYLRGDKRDDEFAKQLPPLVALHKQIADRHYAIANLQTRLSEYRARTDELHQQIVSLARAKHRGSLSRHLSTKFKQISDRVQKLTGEVVDQQQKLMADRFRFLDAIAELTM